MDATPLIAAISAMWLVLVGLASAAFLYLKEQIKVERASASEREDTCKRDCNERVARLEAKVEEQTEIISRQAASQQQQIETQAAMITTLQALLNAKGTAQ